MNFFRILLINLLILLAGCAVSTPMQYWENTVSFNEYAEGVFLRQNEITSEILMLPEGEVGEFDYRDLLESEQKLLDACKLLNEYAVRERDGLSLGLLFKRKVKGTIENCEEMIHETGTLLQNVKAKIE